MMKGDFNTSIAKAMIVVLGLVGSYCILVSVLVKWIYSISLTDPWTYIDYIVSSYLGWLDIRAFFIKIPSEIQPYVQGLGWKDPSVIGFGYKKIFDDLLFSGLFKPLPYLSLICAPIAGMLVRCFSSKKDAKYVRGSKIATEAQLGKIVKNAQRKDTSGAPGIHIAPLVIPGFLETRHVLIAGSTGTGKSILLCQAITDIMKRKRKMIIYDRKGELFAKFGKPSDVLWNPYDERFCGWNIFSEFSLYSGLDHIPPELSTMADSLFSVADNNRNKAFYDGAASIFKSGCCYLKINNRTTNRDLYNFFSSGTDSIAAAIASIPEGLREGQAFLIGGGDVIASFASCLMDRVKAFQPLIGRDGNFSVREWIKNPSNHNVLFLSTAGENEASYLPVLTVLIDIIGNGIRALSENPNRRIFLILDELSSLPPLKTLQMLLREGRSKGASCFLTTQTMASIEDRYGKFGAADIMGLCNSLFVFRTNEPQQSEYFSRALGDAESVKFRQTQGQSKKNGTFIGSDISQSISEQHVTERLFLAGELQSLPIGYAIVKIADYPVAKVLFDNVIISNRNEGFIRRKVQLATAEELILAKNLMQKDAKEKKTQNAERLPATFRI